MKKSTVSSMDTLDLHECCERDQELLRTRSPKSQEYRRSLLRGRRILIVQGGSDSRAFIYRRLRELGVHITILDSSESRWFEHDDVDEFIALDLAGSGGEEGVVRRALSAIEGKKFDGVTTYWEQGVFVAACVGEELGVGMNPSCAFAKAQSKSRTRLAMEKAGLPTPRFTRIYSADDIEEGAKVVGFPAILKPAVGASSVGVTCVNSLEETHTAYKDISRTVDSECSLKMQSKEMILEEMYLGDECDVDVLLCDGMAVYAKVSDNWACAPPSFQELGTNCPSLLSERKQRNLENLAVNSLQAMGFRAGAFHVEVMYTAEGPRLIEINARMGGGSVHEVSLVAWGVDLAEEHAMVSCGIPISPMVPKNPLRYIAVCSINAPYTGTINASRWLDSYVCHKVGYSYNFGDDVTGPEDGLPDRIADVLCVSDVSQQDACEQVREIVMELAVPITPLVAGAEKPFFFPCTRHPFVVDRD